MSDTKLESFCPSCGSKNIEGMQQERTLPMPMGNPVQFKVKTSKCLDCGATGDFQKVNDKAISALLEQSRKESMGKIVDSLVNKGLSMAYMERALELPARTMMRWKNGDYSAGALALLRIIGTYPWTIDVADAKYDNIYATQRLAVEGLNATFQLARKVIPTELTSSSFSEATFFEIKMTIKADIEAAFAIKPSNPNDTIDIRRES